LTPEQLSAALDGAAEAGVYEHLARCPECAMRLEEARLFERRLAGALHRWDCPPAHTLSEYQLGRLAVEAATAVARHAETCPACSSELADLRAFMAAEARPAPQETVADRPSLGARLSGLARQLLPQAPALALRGQTAGGPLTATSGDVVVVVQAERAAPDQVVVLGQLAAPEQDEWTGGLVQLWRDGALERSALLDDSGGFRLEGLPPGKVDLQFTTESGNNLVWPDLPIET
jgi:anti-sigma factor RsiW